MAHGQPRCRCALVLLAAAPADSCAVGRLWRAQAIVCRAYYHQRDWFSTSAPAKCRRIWRSLPRRTFAAPGARGVLGTAPHCRRRSLTMGAQTIRTSACVATTRPELRERLLVLIQWPAESTLTTPTASRCRSTLPIEGIHPPDRRSSGEPSSAFWPQCTVDGVINIITCNPLYDDKDAVAVAGGTQDLTQESAVATFKLDDRTPRRHFLPGIVPTAISPPQYRRAWERVREWTTIAPPSISMG